ncbi:hypothetical protein BDR26DRAFT_864866 [Obelidium mucronatum]|nr:hypothetical protein BDR26DRAFT_864866 [Obelidium mucronatum]
MLTQPRTAAFSSSAETHAQVLNVFETENWLYTVDQEKMAKLEPTIIVAQDTCKVCSIDLATLSEGMACSRDSSAAGQSATTRIVSVNSKTLDDALENSILFLGKELEMEYEADLLVAKTRARFNSLKLEMTSLPQSPRVVLVEWMEPLFLGSGWTAELVKLAGGNLIGSSGRHPDSVLQNLAQGLNTPDIDFIIICLCGLETSTAVKELEQSKLIQSESWYKLEAVRKNQVFVVDGNSMFHRPTPRLLDALEWLIHTLRRTRPLSGADSDFPVVRYDTRKLQKTRSKQDVKFTRAQLDPEIEECHRIACDRHESFYTDPKTGYSVMTEHYLKQRQTCCGNACRHCPYGHSRVKDPARRKNHVKTTVYLNPPSTRKVGDLDALRARNLPPEHSARNGTIVVFWSGGRDSFLALASTFETTPLGTKIVLLTTIDTSNNCATGQNVSAPDIAAQALSLNLPLCLVPIHSGQGNDSYMKTVSHALDTIKGVGELQFLVSGDSFGDIMTWKDNSFKNLGLDCKFPLSSMSSQDLSAKLKNLCDEFDIQLTVATHGKEVDAGDSGETLGLKDDDRRVPSVVQFRSMLQ